ncbi:MAG: tail fiber domain-containing protein [Acidobacteria bacterium]|nr:tail fiber domain-containing protein [Acidobacteriota bacterium]
MNIVSSCSSSARYKDNLRTFSSGLDLIHRLRPVSFNWTDGGLADLGLIAEEVAAAEPLLTTTNAKGEIEGVKYDRVGVVLVNAVKEQQTQIETLEAKVEEQNELLRNHKAEIDALKKFICNQNPDAAFCAAKPQPQ